MATVSSARPAWQRGALFQFFSSIKLAVVLLAVLIIGAIAGTIWESSFDAKVARAYVYGAPWFNFWLVLLGANLTVSALSRWPWKKHHVAFLITHLGIITLLTGSLIGRIWGIEGTITLFKGEPPTNRLLVDEHQLRVHDSDGIVKGYRAEFLHHPPTPPHPRDLGPLAEGAHLSVIDYANAIDARLNPKALSDGGVPALHLKINTQMMGQNLETWMLADDPQHGNFAMGLAKIEFKRGKARHPERSEATSRDPSEVTLKEAQRDPSAALRMADLEESIFAFAKTPQQIAHAAKGGSTGAKVSLSQPSNGDKGSLTISLDGRATTIEVAQNLKKEIPLDGATLRARIENYWPDFRMENGKPVSVSDAPNNPAIVVTIHGRGIPVAAQEDFGHPERSEAQPRDPAEVTSKEMPRNPSAPLGMTGAPTMNDVNAAANHLTIFVADDSALSYELKSRKAGDSAGALELNKPLTTGWADWQLVADKFLPHAEQWMDFSPAKNPATELPDGISVRVQQNGKTFEQWIPAGWEIRIPTVPQGIGVAYGWKNLPLPIGLELLDFEVKRNEGSDAPAGFKSTVRVSTADGESATGQCWMNNPFSFPSGWWHTWSGQTFKMSQASWNPENLSQSTIQILRDPGWLLKWIGSLLIVTGVFLMFYVKKFRRASAKTAPAKISEKHAPIVAAVEL